MDIIYILKIISIIVFPIILGINIWNVYTKSDDKADTTAWYRNGIFDIADEFPDLFEFMLWIGSLFGFLFLMIKKGPGKNSTDHGTYYGLSFTLFFTLLFSRFQILVATAKDISYTSKGDSLKPDPDTDDYVSGVLKYAGPFPAGLTLEKKGIVLTSGIYITYFFSVLLVFLMVIERINSNVKWDFSDFSIPIPGLSSIISGSTAHYIMQIINMYLFVVISAYVIYQFKLLKIKKTCPPGTTLSPCYPPKKALSRLSTTKCKKGIKPVCNNDPYIKCTVNSSGIITGDESNKIILTHDNDKNVIISPNNKKKITSDCEESIKAKILPKLKYT